MTLAQIRERNLLIAQAIDRGEPSHDVMYKYKVSIETVRRVCRLHDVPLEIPRHYAARTISTLEDIFDIIGLLCDKDCDMTYEEIGLQFNVTDGRIGQIAKECIKHKIPIVRREHGGPRYAHKKNKEVKS